MGGRRFGAWFNASWPLILALIIMLSIIAPAAHAQKASPSIRHPPDLKDPISSLLDAGLIPTLTYEEYVVLSWQLSRVLSNLLAETLASQGSTIGNEDLGVAVAMLAASETLSRLPENYSPEAESVLDKAKNVVEGLEIFMLAYGLDEDKPYASTTIAVALSDAGGEPSFTLIGPASHVLLTLVNAVIIDDQTVVLFPVSSRVVLATPRGELPGSVNVGPGRPNIEDKIRDELLPDEVKQSYGRGIASPQAEVEPEDNERGGGGNSIIDISSLLRELASRLTNPEYPGAGGRGASIPHSGIADDSNTAAIVASPIGRLGITYEDFARIAEALRLNLPSASAGDGLEGGEVLVPVSPIERAGSSLGLVIAAVLVFGTIALAAAYAPDLRRAIVSRLVLSRGYSVEGAVESCFREALQVLKDMGLKREPWETPREFLARVEGSLEAEQVYAMRYITSLYERHRYGGWEPSTGELEECIRSVEALRSRGRGG